MSRPDLPLHWSPEQALAVYEYLQQLSEQLWFEYHAEFIELLGQQAAEVLQPSNPPRPTQLDLFDDNLNEHDLPF